MNHTRFFAIATASLGVLLSACVDTTGLSETLSRPAHPDSNANSLVIVQEFGDLQCPSCKAAHDQLNPLLLEKFGKDIRFEFVHFPLQALHPWALTAAEASECAADQGKFWEFLDLDYAEQTKLSGTQTRVWAEQLGLDMDTFERCTKSHIKRDAILEEYDQGSKLGVRGTPTYLVNGVAVDATGDDLTKAIEEAIAKTKNVKL